MVDGLIGLRFRICCCFAHLDVTGSQELQLSKQKLSLRQICSRAYLKRQNVVILASVLQSISDSLTFHLVRFPLAHGGFGPEWQLWLWRCISFFGPNCVSTLSELLCCLWPGAIRGLYVTLKVRLCEGKGVELSWWKESILALACPIIQHRSLRRRYYSEILKVLSLLRQCSGAHPHSSNKE